ncbi:hypothetical protein [Mailhella sp.]
MPSLRTLITLAVLAAFCAGSFGYVSASSLGFVHAGNIDEIMASPEYQQQKAAHLARLRALEAAH